ncbi:hypothetical protein FQN57_003719 [Myotisia sp. PD_48]|nr:hypothetical protein FQN57_003719 [Myotisia sp. PD_48]
MYGGVIIIFLVSGLSIPRQKLVKHMLNWRLHLLVQGISFLFFPAIMMALIHLVYATDRQKRIDVSVLAGYIFVGCLPTTISSNVLMTRMAGGDEAAALVEVLIANKLGPVITPGWTVTLLPQSVDFDLWRNANTDMGSMYRNVFKELGLTVLVPLTFGQVLRWSFPDTTAKILQKFHLGKVSTICLVLIVWVSFSTCFGTNALQSFTTETVLFAVFFNIALYNFFTVICFILSYPPKFLLFQQPILRYVLYRLPPGEVIAICFCGAAKTSGLGIPLLYAMYDGASLSQKAKTSVPIILYMTEQILCAHFMVHMFLKWKVKKQTGDVENADDQTVGEGGDGRTSTTVTINMAEGELREMRQGGEKTSPTRGSPQGNDH